MPQSRGAWCRTMNWRRCWAAILWRARAALTFRSWKARSRASSPRAAKTSLANSIPRRDKAIRFARAIDEAFALRPELRSLPQPDTIVCRCEDVTVERLQPCASFRAAKLHTRCGMGPCEGRICGPAASFLFGWQDESIRPPVLPARIGTLAVFQAIGSRTMNLPFANRVDSAYGKHMETLHVELPADLVKAAKFDEGNLSKEAARVIALDLFRERTVSLGRAAELCETPLAIFMEYAAAHGVPPLNYDEEDLAEDRQTIEKLHQFRS